MSKTTLFACGVLIGIIAGTAGARMPAALTHIQPAAAGTAVSPFEMMTMQPQSLPVERYDAF
ncbi:MAG: hypothetical protein K2Y71_25400 [Xanthobacteraceae bacterium]|nr:hypothetical protein [Xanthobacteraceae bacterium]